MMKIFLSVIGIVGCAISGFAQNAVLKAFPLSAVHLSEGPFKEAQKTDLKYILSMEPDRLLAPYLREAGLEPKAKSYGNWENTGLDGHIGGHYLSALSLMYASTGNTEAKSRLDYMIDQLEICQQKSGDGYVGGIPGGRAIWNDIAKGKINAETFSLNKKWVPLYNIHKLYAGLIDAYKIAGSEKAKTVLIKLSDWCLNLTANLSEEQMQNMLRSEHGGLNETFADVAHITGDKKYLELARRFSHRFILDPLLQKKDALTGLHANTQIPKVIGFMRVAEEGNDTSWANAADFFWETVVKNRSISIGGNSVREHFNPVNNFSAMIESKEGPETCNTYNMLKLSKNLFLANPDAKYMDYYERATYNHILSTQHPNGGFVYFTPIRPQHYRVYSKHDEGFWCCVGSGLENHGKYGELIYAHNDKDVFVNLFMASSLNWKEKGLTLLQNTKFPFEETSEIRIELTKSRKFALNLRYPSWVKQGLMKVFVNNKEIEINSEPSSYITINRKWKNGDVITLSVPMHTKTEPLPDNSNWLSFVHGPIVLAATTTKEDMPGLIADDSRMGHIANGRSYSLESAPLIVSATNKFEPVLETVDSKALRFKASNLIYQDNFKNLELLPFFQVHDARYMLYWPVNTLENLAESQKELKKKEALKLALEASTIDQIAPGEQQPESDHNFQGDKTESGVFSERHWRHAEGWFSYDLKNPDKNARNLRIMYSGSDIGRTFDIYLNNELLKTVTLDGSQGGAFYDVDYQLTDQMMKNQPSKLKLKFVAKPGSIAGGIYYIRLMK